MISGPPAKAIEETVTGVTARIREWIGLKIPGIIWIRYVSDVSREKVIDRLSFATAVERIEFDPSDPTQAAGWFEEQLRNIPPGDSLPVVAADFSPLFRFGAGGFSAAFRSLNLRREVIARMPLVQLWWIPASVAATAEAEALDLASWFQIRMTLSEIAPAAKSGSSTQVEESRSTSRSRQSLKSLQDAVERQRRLASVDPESYLPPLAAALIALADRYSGTQQLKRAEQSYQEALATYRRLVEANREAPLPDVAMTLNKLANLYRATQRIKESEKVYQEALAISRNLAEASPEAGLPDVAMTLNNLAILYSDTQRMKESELSYQEALTIRRSLAEANPVAYLPNVAATLNNLGVLHRDAQRMKESEQCYREALTIRRSLAEANRRHTCRMSR